MPLILATMLLMMSGPAADAPGSKATEATEAWSRFRGPNGSGVSVSTHLPAELGPAKNVVWKTALPFGHSSPALTRDRIFLTGTRVEKLDTRNGPAGPTPATDGVNVYVFFADFGLLSYDVDGHERWRVPLGP